MSPPPLIPYPCTGPNEPKEFFNNKKAGTEVAGYICNINLPKPRRLSKKKKHQDTPKRAYLSSDVLERCWVDQREADEEYISLGIGERPQPVVVLLSSSVPETQVDRLAVHHHVGRVVVEPGEEAGGGAAGGE